MAKIGQITDHIINLLNLSHITDKDIYIGPSNVAHMQKCHPSDYQKYKNDIALILSDPDYVGINKKDNSIEYVKEYIIDDEFVKVAVRVSTKGKLFVRSMYILNKKRVLNFIQKGTLKKV